ncbi:TPA: NYN domain-containing protein [Candidatus Woesearchaeota archaeon]|nr:NYN domain-containing protein [Candidatus Woesearchaeota archaeon]HIH31252.1 NYN domain-containing protein [Candidatus Woesearchaeota archaeon]HIJ13533.1 NYN domain-containing protein [Candidatus Woesearchaeota archaeon]
MTKHKEQRVAVFVDVQNMYYSAKNLFGRKLNFGMLLKRAVGQRKLIRAIAYAIKADIAEEQNFRDALFNMGYEVKTKDLQVFYGGHKKGDWDVGIAMDTIRLAPKVDTIVLVSGDGDFADLVVYLKGMGCRVEIIGFEKTTSTRLLDVADDYVAVDKKMLL